MEGEITMKYTIEQIRQRVESVYAKTVASVSYTHLMCIRDSVKVQRILSDFSDHPILLIVLSVYVKSFIQHYIHGCSGGGTNLRLIAKIGFM